MTSRPRRCARRRGPTFGSSIDSRGFPGRACRDYLLRQEFITPYTPEQNGVIERVFRSLEEECAGQHSFGSYREARRTIARWIDWYNAGRPRQALGYLSPDQFRAQQATLVA